MTRIQLSVTVSGTEAGELAGPYCRYNAEAKATKFEPRDDGQVLVTLWGGRQFLTGQVPAFRLEYEGGMDSYMRSIDVFGLVPDRPWLFEAWHPERSEIHTYAFAKVIGLTDQATGETVDGARLCALMGGRMQR